MKAHPGMFVIVEQSMRVSEEDIPGAGLGSVTNVVEIARDP